MIAQHPIPASLFSLVVRYLMKSCSRINECLELCTFSLERWSFCFTLFMFPTGIGLKRSESGICRPAVTLHNSLWKPRWAKKCGSSVWGTSTSLQGSLEWSTSPTSSRWHSPSISRKIQKSVEWRASTWSWERTTNEFNFCEPKTNFCFKMTTCRLLRSVLIINWKR